MPITLPPISRRTLLAASVAAAVSPAAGRRAGAADVKVDPHRIALLSDVHVHEDRATKKDNTVVMWDNFQQAVTEVAALDPRPAAAIVNGDCAFHNGTAADYATFLDGLAPLRKAG